MMTVPIDLLGTKVDCRGYRCSHCREKEGADLPTPQFIFYIMATNRCNGSCGFCDIQKKFVSHQDIDPDIEKLRRVLEDLYGRNLISKISVTGGEPLINPVRTGKLLRTIFEVNPDAKVDLTTNGSLLAYLRTLDCADRLTTIHLSRHHYDTATNNGIFHLRTADGLKIRQLAQRFPGKISLNCCLVRGFIDSPKKVEEYLDWAASIKDLKSAGFISLMNKNAFCKDNFVAEGNILSWIDEDKYNFDHNYQFDTDICECRVWTRVAKNYFPIMAFWWKVNRLEIPYCRQLVFTADNRISVNFHEIAEINF